MRAFHTAPSFTTSTLIFHPAPSAKRVVPEVQAGLGGANMKFYYNQQDCNAFTGCSNSSSYLQSSNHFQLHAGAGVSFFVTPNVYVRPQFDLHWVHNFFQFGTNWVPQYGVSVGYRFGGRLARPGGNRATASGALARSSNACGGL